MYLSQVKRKNITVGQYSMTAVSWFLILSEHTKIVCAAHRRNSPPFPMYPFRFPRGILFVAGSWCGRKSNACGLCCSTWGLQAFFMVLCRVLTRTLHLQNAGPIDASVDGSTAGHLPPGLPSLSKSTQNCCAHKNEVMKTNSPVCQF